MFWVQMVYREEVLISEGISPDFRYGMRRGRLYEHCRQAQPVMRYVVRVDCGYLDDDKDSSLGVEVVRGRVEVTETGRMRAGWEMEGASAGRGV